MRILLVDFANAYFTHYHRKDKHKAWEFICNIRAIAEQYRVDRICFAQEGGQSKYRLGILPTYKGDRKARREKADAAEKARYEKFKSVEMPEVTELAGKLGIHSMKVFGVEADDIIAYVATHLDTEQHQLMILSTDSDLNQLIRHGVVQGAYNSEMVGLLTQKKKLTKDKWVNFHTYHLENGIVPEMFAHVKALSGDTSDSVPSPKGLGEKIAFALVMKYGDICDIEKCLDDLDVPRLGPKVKALLKEQFSDIHRNLKLVNLYHSKEALPQVFGGEGGLRQMRNLFNDIFDERSVDLDYLKEYCCEYGKLDVAENIEQWVKPFCC